MLILLLTISIEGVLVLHVKNVVFEHEQFILIQGKFP